MIKRLDQITGFQVLDSDAINQCSRREAVVHFVGDDHVDADFVEVDGVGAILELPLGALLGGALPNLLLALVAGLVHRVAALPPEVLRGKIILGDGVQVQFLERRFADDHEIVVVLAQGMVLALALIGVVVAAGHLAVLDGELAADGQHPGAGEPLVGLGVPVGQHRLRHNDDGFLRVAGDLRHACQQQALHGLAQAHVVAQDTLAGRHRLAQAGPDVRFDLVGVAQAGHVDGFLGVGPLHEAAELPVVEVFNLLPVFRCQEPFLEFLVHGIDLGDVVLPNAGPVQVLLHEAVHEAARDFVDTLVERHVRWLQFLVPGRRRELRAGIGHLGIPPGVEDVQRDEGGVHLDFHVVQGARADGFFQAGHLVFQFGADGRRQFSLGQVQVRHIQAQPQATGQVGIHRRPVVIDHPGVVGIRRQVVQHFLAVLPGRSHHFIDRERPALALERHGGGQRVE